MSDEAAVAAVADGGCIRELAERASIVRIAREWVGTPYEDCAEVKGRNGGVDCAKLLKCVFLEAGLIPPIAIPDYSPQWFLHQADEKYLGQVSEHAREIAIGDVKPGDVALWKIGRCFSHGAIVDEPGWPRIIHAWSGARMVIRASAADGQLGKPNRERRFFTRW